MTATAAAATNGPFVFFAFLIPRLVSPQDFFLCWHLFTKEEQEKERKGLFLVVETNDSFLSSNLLLCLRRLSVRMVMFVLVSQRVCMSVCSSRKEVTHAISAHSLFSCLCFPSCQPRRRCNSIPYDSMEKQCEKFSGGQHECIMAKELDLASARLLQNVGR